MLLRKQAVLLQPESMGIKIKRHFVQTLYRHHILKTPKLLILRNNTLPLVRVRVPLSAHNISDLAPKSTHTDTGFFNYNLIKVASGSLSFGEADRSAYPSTVGSSTYVKQ